MPLVGTEFRVDAGLPNYDGMHDEIPLQFDHRFDPTIYGEWLHNGTEYIKPLRAVGPKANVFPVNNTLATPAFPFREVQATGNPSVTWIEHSNGRVETVPATALASQTMVYTGGPSISWGLLRQSPPPDQAVAIYSMVQWTATRNGVSGRIALVLPVATEVIDWDSHDRPFIHYMFPYTGPYDLLNDGEIVSHGTGGSSLAQGQNGEMLVIEFQNREAWYDDQDTDLHELTGLLGGMDILIRRGSTDTWWHHYDPELESVSGGSVIVSCSGSIQTFNIAPITYRDASILPPADVRADTPSVEYSDTVSYGTLRTLPADWGVSVAEQAGFGTVIHRPELTFTRGAGSTFERPLAWYLWQDHAPVFGHVNPSIATTEGTHALRAMSWETDWTGRGSRGTMEFHRLPGTTILPGLRVNGQCWIYGGWDEYAPPGMQTGLLSAGYVDPQEFARLREGEEGQGDPGIEFDLGAFDEVRLPRKASIATRQAAGRLVGEWARSIGQVLGISPSRIYVLPALETVVIPANDLPSKPVFDVPDGMQLEQHLREVTDALGTLRVGFDGTQIGGQYYTMWVDTGPPDYVPGSSEISYIVDISTEDDDTGWVWRISNDAEAGEFRNSAKFLVGEAPNERVTYVVETVPERLAALGDTWSLAEAETDADAIATLYARYLLENYSMTELLAWEGPAHRSVGRDLFVQVAYAPNIGVTVGSVYQILNHRIEFFENAGNGDMDGESSWLAKLVYVP